MYRNGNSSIFDLFDFAIIDEGIDNLLNLIILQLDIGDARASHERSHAFCSAKRFFLKQKKGERTSTGIGGSAGMRTHRGLRFPAVE